MLTISWFVEYTGNELDSLTLEQLKYNCGNDLDQSLYACGSSLKICECR